MRRAGALIVLQLLLAAACGGGNGAAGLGDTRVRLVEIADLEEPLALATRPGDRTLYVAQRTGRVVAVRSRHVVGRPVLDLSGRVSLGGEQGLLGLAFSPDGRYLYVDFTDTNGDTRVEQYAFRGERADPGTRREILFVDQPYANHNGGEVTFGPDGMLYIGLGDGGSGGDPMDNAQSRGTLLGKILRIRPTPDGPAPYEVPADNPFVGVDGARPEIWALGLRNPWRFSFDRSTGDLWIGDVGQSAWEEVDRVEAGVGGANLGWNRMEGDHPYTDRPPPADALGPVYEYTHGAGRCVVTGGFVYRGRAIPELEGSYVFADFCTGEITAFDASGTNDVRARSLGPALSSLSSFGEDAAGELYAMSLSGGLYRLAPGR
ncbi:MAG: sorbosone dehydrogenase family protein [Actinomycetota bacterium]